MHHLITKGVVKNQEAFGQSLGYPNKSSFSQTMKRDASPLFLKKIKEAYPEFDNFRLDTNNSDINQEEIKSENNSSHSIVVKEPFEQYVVTNKSGNEISNMPDGGFLMKVPLVPVRAYARYISEGDSAEFLENAEYVFFKVDHVAKGSYMAFQIKGDSFWNEGGYDTPDKAIVLARELQRVHWRDGFRESQLGWIIITRQNIVLKDIIAQDLEQGIITCHSRNPSPEYSDFKLSLDEDVKCIYKVIKRQF